MDKASKRVSTASDASATPHSSGNRLFAGGGETGTILANINWADTPLGPVETWPQTLRTSVRICLSSRHAIIVWWGPDLVFFYNDAYAPTLGIKRPWAAGKPGREVWSEIWDTIGPMLEGVLRTGEPTWSDDQMLFLERSDYLEETYHTFSYSPIEDDTGACMGVFTAVTETTQRVLGERRTRLARDLAAALVNARSTEEVCARAASVLASDAADIPFALLYGVDTHTGRATLLDTTGLVAGTPLSPQTVDLAEAGPVRNSESGEEVTADPWSLVSVTQSGQETLVRNIGWHGVAPTVEPGLTARDALVLPLIEPGQTTPTMVLVAGVSPRRVLDAEYRAFYTLLTNHLSTALAAAHAYEEERRRAEALAEIDRAKTAFFSNVSHEFRTPLTLLLGPLEDSLADLDVALPPHQRERLEVMQRNGVRLLKLVNTLLDFARIEAGRMQATYEMTDLAVYTTELASSFRSLVEKAGMELIVDCPPLADLTEPIYVDRDMWEKIVLNLLSNAFKFTFAGSITVSIHILGDGRHVELIVRDTGVGIPASELPYLFERFHRVEGTRARTHEGSGIGLALVQELVHLHSGMIHAESVEGEGTTFFVRLPIGVAHLPSDRIQPNRAPATLTSTALGAVAYVGEAARWLPDIPMAGGDVATATRLELNDSLARSRVQSTSLIEGGRQSARIVLADDNADMREYLARLLSEHYAVETVIDGAQALAAIRRDPPDLVLSDVMMPELDGFGLLRELHADPHIATVPVILLSARAGEEATVEGLKAGADDYLVKPFSAREVLTRVAARLEIARSRAEAERRTHEVLEALLETTRRIIMVEHVDGVAETAQQLVMLARQVVGCEIVSLIGVSETTGAIVPLATLGRTAEDAAAWYATLGEYHCDDFFTPDQLRQLLAGEVLVRNVLSNIAHGRPHYGIGSTAAAPLLRDGALRGILSFAYTATAHPYSAVELALASGFARMALLVLDRERLLREREVARLREVALAEANRRMDEFLGIASHELRTPLTSVTANIQMAERRLLALRQHITETTEIQSSGPTSTPAVHHTTMLIPTPSSTTPDSTHAVASGTYIGARTGSVESNIARAHWLLERTSRQLVRMDRLVGDLLDTSRIQAGKLEMRLERCDLLEIVRDAVQEQRTAWPTRTISLDLPRHAVAPLLADADRIGQVVTNYLTNALKYSPGEQPVAARVRMQDGVAYVEIADKGPGLSPEQCERLFARFYRVPGIEQQSGSGVGLGLGLYICKTIVERHGGRVGVESVQGMGSTFWFTVPCAASDH